MKNFLFLKLKCEKNGEGGLVVMDIETYNRREKMLKLREELLAVEEDRMAGRTGTTVDELDAWKALWRNNGRNKRIDYYRCYSE